MADVLTNETDLPPGPILSLDGGGAKGVYTLGVLKEVEAISGKPLGEVFSLIYGTSTGAIIAALLALGKTVEESLGLYMSHVPRVMGRRSRNGKTEALQNLADEIFGNSGFGDFKTHIGIVCTNWEHQAPMIFKSHGSLAHGLKSTFKPGFGCKIAKAVVASCSAYPFFNRQLLKTENQGVVELFDGGYCANNPTLFAIVDALQALKFSRNHLKVLSLGCGGYPEPRRTLWRRCVKRLTSVQLLQRTLGVNVTTMEILCKLLYPDIEMVRVNDSFTEPHLATDFLEASTSKLNSLYQKGRQSFADQENAIRHLINYANQST